MCCIPFQFSDYSWFSCFIALQRFILTRVESLLHYMWSFPKIKLLLFSADYCSSVLSEAEESWMVHISFRCSSIAFSSSSSFSSFLISHLEEKSHLSIFVTSKLQSTLKLFRAWADAVTGLWSASPSLFFYSLFLTVHQHRVGRGAKLSLTSATPGASF